MLAQRATAELERSRITAGFRRSEPLKSGRLEAERSRRDADVHGSAFLALPFSGVRDRAACPAFLNPTVRTNAKGRLIADNLLRSVVGEFASPTRSRTYWARPRGPEALGQQGRQTSNLNPKFYLAGRLSFFLRVVPRFYLAFGP